MTGVALADPGSSASWVMMSGVESRPPASLGLCPSLGGAQDSIRGVLLDLVLVSVLLATMAPAGWLRPTDRVPARGPALGWMLYVAVLWVLAALSGNTRGSRTCVPRGRSGPSTCRRDRGHGIDSLRSSRGESRVRMGGHGEYSLGRDLARHPERANVESLEVYRG